MKKFVLFLKGLKLTFKDSWCTILILFATCVIGIIGVGFCYRTAVFYIRQPEFNAYCQNERKIAYATSGENLNVCKEIDIEGYFGMEVQTIFEFDNQKFDLSLYSYDNTSEQLIDFESSKKNIVLSQSIHINIGDKVKIGESEWLVVGKTQGKSYASVASFEQVCGEIIIYFDKQLTKAKLSKLEKIIGAKFDCYGDLQNALGTMQFIFMALGVFVILLISINVFRLLFVYKQKNELRYKLYRMIGVSSFRLNLIMFGELFLIILLCLPIPLMIDILALRPLTMFVGITFMYDIIDVLIISACVIVPFALMIILQMIYQSIVTANGSRKNGGGL